MTKRPSPASTPPPRRSPRWSPTAWQSACSPGPWATVGDNSPGSPSRCTSRTWPGRPTSGRCEDRDQVGQAKFMSRASSVYVVVPDGIDDGSRPSGGNTYDRRICRELPAVGWTVNERAVAGCWPHPSEAACATPAGGLGRLPDDAVVLLDGLIASAAPQVLQPEATRLRLVVLMHMPLGLERPTGPPRCGGGPDLGGDFGDGESVVLSSAVAVITTSAWTRSRLLDRYGLPPERVYVATPGVDAA